MYFETSAGTSTRSMIPATSGTTRPVDLADTVAASTRFVGSEGPWLAMRLGGRFGKLDCGLPAGIGTGNPWGQTCP
jgi:hypothetical protein